MSLPHRVRHARDVLANILYASLVSFVAVVTMRYTRDQGSLAEPLMVVGLAYPLLIVLCAGPPTLVLACRDPTRARCDTLAVLRSSWRAMLLLAVGRTVTSLLQIVVWRTLPASVSTGMTLPLVLLSENTVARKVFGQLFSPYTTMALMVALLAALPVADLANALVGDSSVMTWLAAAALLVEAMFRGACNAVERIMFTPPASQFPEPQFAGWLFLLWRLLFQAMMTAAIVFPVVQVLYSDRLLAFIPDTLSATMFSPTAESAMAWTALIGSVVAVELGRLFDLDRVMSTSPLHVAYAMVLARLVLLPLAVFSGLGATSVTLTDAVHLTILILAMHMAAKGMARVTALSDNPDFYELDLTNVPNKSEYKM